MITVVAASAALREDSSSLHRRRFVSFLKLGLLFTITLLAVVGCGAPEKEEEDVTSSQGEAFSGNRSAAPSMTQIDRPSYAPEAFYPEANVGGYYGPCGPLSATWLMTWYVGRGPGGTGSNQGCFDRVSSFAQGDRLLPGSSPYGLSYAIDRVLAGSAYESLARYKTGATIEEIRDLITTGHPVIVLIQWLDEGATIVTMHYITLFSFRQNPTSGEYTYVAHDNGSFQEITQSVLEGARDTSFYNRGIVWMDRPTSSLLEQSAAAAP